MAITQKSIDDVLQTADIVQFIGKSVTLKKSGTNWTGCCPFHDEKSASFVVSPNKGIFKCFGCGKGGNVISFVMENKRIDFPEAVKEIAKDLGISVEETVEREDKEVVEKRKTLLDMTKDATEKFQKALQLADDKHWVKDMIKLRKISADSLVDWKLGYAPDSWDYLSKKIIDAGLYGYADEIGLIKKSANGEARVYDVFRDRLMFPIIDRRGQVIGFSGRKNNDNNKDNPKYINSKESMLYRKYSALYGIFQAEREIRKKDTAVVVEGNIDVIMMHQGGVTNTVATCGTALTETHAQQLKKLCNHVILIMDGDAAGQKATLKSIDILFSAGLSVTVVELDKDDDPDTMVQFVLQSQTLKEGEEANDSVVYQYIQEKAVDAVVYKAEKLFKQAGDDINAADEAFTEICESISLIISESKREAYARKLSRTYKSFKESAFLKKINGFVKERDDVEQVRHEKESAIPAWINKEKFYTKGFDAKIDGMHNTGVYFHTGEKGAKQLTNFVINPLIHIYSKDDTQNRRLTEVDNGITKAVLELPSKAFSSVDQFESILMNEGVYFLMDGFTKSHLNKLKSQLLREYPKCFELKTLGWQPEGFWAFYNRIYKDTVLPFNDYGYTELDGVNYLSMAASSIQGEVRAEDDLYKNDRFLQWSTPVITFKDWSKLMVDTYGDNGYRAVMYVFVTLFRDVVYSLKSSCPHLYAYGPVGSGKSVFAESISNLFFNQMPFFNLNQGTDFAFFNRLERFRNCPVGFNEFDEHAIKEEWFRAIKSAFDGEGREKGSMTRKKKTETQDIQCTIILIGQFLSTKDDASVLSRTIPCEIKANHRTQLQTDSYNKLKAYEKAGLGGILVELLQHRALIDKKYAEVYAKEFKKLTEAFEKDNIKVKTRIQNNFCTMLAMRSLLNDLVYFPFSYEDFFEKTKYDIISLSHLISESDSLASFWKTIEFMSEQDMIEDGWDYKIEVKDELPIMLSRADRGSDNKDTRLQKFEEPKKLLFIRMTTIHPLYMNATRQQTGKTGLNQETITRYMVGLESYVGMIKSTSFKSKNGTSKISNAYVFDYDMLGMNIEKTTEPIGRPYVLEGEILQHDALAVITPGGEKLQWKMNDIRSLKGDDKIKATVEVTCWWEEFQHAGRLTKGTRVKIHGLLTESKSGDTIKGQLIVQSLEFVSSIPAPVPAENTDWRNEIKN